jgi:hypothetical protein
MRPVQRLARFTMTVLILLPIAACGDSSPAGPEDLNCTGGAPLSVGATVNGTLEEGDDLDIDGAFLDRYALTVNQGGQIEITMRSTAVDAFLWLLETNESVIAFDDDSGGGPGGLDARITRNLSTGCYLVEATSAFPGETGPYTLEVRRL